MRTFALPTEINMKYEAFSSIIKISNTNPVQRYQFINVQLYFDPNLNVTGKFVKMKNHYRFNCVLLHNR